MILKCLRHRAKNNPEFTKFLFECRCDRDAVEHCVHRNARKSFLFFERYSQFCKRLHEIRVGFFYAVELRLLLRSRVVNNILIVYRTIFDI